MCPLHADAGRPRATAAQATSITTHVVNPGLWQPQSGVAGYVPGMQCDV